MQITDIKIRRTHQEGRMKAIVSVTFDDELAVHDIKIIEGEERLFLAMPTRKMADGSYRDIAHPIRSELRGMIERMVLEHYQAALLEEAQHQAEEGFGE